VSDRVQELIRTLRLERHPEGGWFREFHRALERVTLVDGSTRSASTAIHFLLAGGEVSRWHRVSHDEVWHFYEGAGLELLWVAPDWSTVHVVSLGAATAAVVPAGAWQAARPLGDYALAGCTVAPGFEFEDWTLLREDAAADADLRRRFPEYAGLI
jgi:uncharacterized protein